MKPFYEVFDWGNIENFLPVIPIIQLEDFTLYSKQKMEENLGTLLPLDSNFAPINQPKHCKHYNQPPNAPTQVPKTVYPNVNDPSTPFSNLNQPVPAPLTTHDKTIFPRPSSHSISNSSAALALTQMIP